MQRRYEYKRNRKNDSIIDAIQQISDKFDTIHPHLDDIMFTTKCHDDSGWFDLNGLDQSIVNLDNIHTSSDTIQWNDYPMGINPSSGELNEIRSQRKCQQLEGMIKKVESEIVYFHQKTNSSNLNNNSCNEDVKVSNGRILVFEFGCGSGHLGLLIAYRNPLTVHVVLIERKEYCVNVMKQRVNDLNLTNVTIICQDIRDFIQEYTIPLYINEEPVVGLVTVSLHSCGLLTDLIIEFVLYWMNIYKYVLYHAFVLCPCCYGQLSHPPIDEKDEYSIIPYDTIYNKRKQSILFNNRDNNHSINILHEPPEIPIPPGFQYDLFEIITSAAEIVYNEKMKWKSANLKNNIFIPNIISSKDGMEEIGSVSINENENNCNKDNNNMNVEIRELNNNNNNSKRKLNDILLCNISKICMRIIDMDRLLQVLQYGQAHDMILKVYMSSIIPLHCSPKNNIIVCRQIHL